MAKKKVVSRKKAKKILKHGSVRGKKLTPKQKGFFGARAGGQPIKRKTSGSKRKKAKQVRRKR